MKTALRLFLAMFLCWQFVCCSTVTTTTTAPDGSVIVTKTTALDVPGINAIGNATAPILGPLVAAGSTK